MKTMIFALAMLLTAATAYNQTSRKPANGNTATNTKERKVVENRSNTSRDGQNGSLAANERRSVTTNTTTVQRTEQTTTTRPVTRQTVTSRGNNNTANVHPNTRENRSNVTNHTNTNTTTVHNTRENRNNTNTNSTAVQQPATGRAGVNRTQVVEYESPRVYRETHRVVHHYQTPPATREYRSVHYVYRRPIHYEVYWTPVMHRQFIEIYPMVTYWDYYPGYRIELISAYDACYYRGNVMTVYGEVSEVYYSRATDEYILYFGAYYPYHDFTVVLPGYLARRYSRHPEWFFENQNMAVTGLITTFNSQPEIVVRKSFQINLY
jgi:hypothetical protein